MISRWPMAAMAATLSVGLAGCVPEQVKQADQRPIVSSAPLGPTEPIRFTQIVSAIRTGTLTGTLASNWTCTEGDELRWRETSGDGLRSPEYGAHFVEAMSRAGYRVSGNPDRLFDVEAERLAARFLVGAKLIEVQHNLCADRSGVYGNTYIAVEWQVYSLTEQRVIYTARTDGNARLDKGVLDATRILTRTAFGNASANFAADERFRELVSTHGSPGRPVVEDAPLQIPRYGLFRDNIGGRLADLRAAAVTVFAGGGQGSGFFISDDGYILTNRHVVGEAETVSVRLLVGVELTGRVLRRHVERDVALVKVDLGRTQPLPLRLEAARLGEEVYALGSPLRPELAGSVTRGIVSAMRRQSRGTVNLDMIQTDATIHSGNSGGPLLDSSGNVIGIAVSGEGTRDFGVGVNFFIPIDDALRYLNIRLGAVRELRF